MKWKKIYNDKVKRKLFEYLEIRNTSLKSLLKSRLFNNILLKSTLGKQIFSYDKNCFLTKINNLCIFTGRQKGVYRLFRISRIEVRKSVSKSNIFGLRKSSF